MRGLARAFPADVYFVERLYARLSGVARVAASASSADFHDASDSLDKSRHERRRRRHARRAFPSILVAITVLCTSEACRSTPQEPERQDGFQRVVAQVQGIT